VASHGATVSGRQTTSSQSAAAGALVGVNGGFFVIDPADGIPGTPAGIGVYRGELDREATNGRVDLVLGDGGKHPEIEGLTTKMTVRAGSASRPVNGINRKPGLIRDCGEPGGRPTDKPRHDTTCTNPDELVQITPDLGGPSPDGAGVEAVLDAHAKVTALRPRGGAVPADGSVLQGIGDGAAWLNAHARPGTRLTLDKRVTDDHGHPVRFDPSDSVVGGGPWLVRDGRIWINAAHDGLVHPDDPAWIYGWALKRNPRTMVGTDAHGRLLVVTVDGRQAGFSEGFSITEAAAFMRSLGAVEAMNLDGGGSTAMAVHGELVTSPSDATGERPVGDTVLVLPPGA
jgi:phosphodiester glycosidase